ncbi:hypothetical protein [Apilactobacillus timberlakei]|uniref:ABC transporter permease n=2 Tax=Apilactobacillus timberlakei TaxID=2008380 RepID=A0ABY2YRY1_9LACO|nr:hypothetical protein [Apilactobacillus timberlakei]TPR12655.1 hypothetical protein DYZ97_06250 [Apilactobacillus timberlakei]TPR13484.1 hypothetical protein DY048_06165 [Apilactobacillus timberlakei]TPR15557.1 hypothetical protein DY052_05450 [Apilactobacillus timberlakei]
MKELDLYKNLIKRYLFYLLIFSCVFGLMNLIFNHSPLFSLLHSISYYLYGYTVALVTLNYYLFNLSISSGISRNGLYRVKLYSLSTITFFINIFIFSINLFSYILNNKQTDSIYMNLYFGFFNNNIINFISMFIIGFITIFFIMILFNTLGTFLSLFNVLGKIITFFVIYAMIHIGLISFSIYYFVFGFKNINLQPTFDLITGLNTSTAGGGNTGNPISIAITLILFTCLLLFINYKLTKKFQIRK